MLPPSGFTLEQARDVRTTLVCGMTAAVEAISVDCRDPWPTNPGLYLKTDTLAQGMFGSVKAADCRDPAFGFNGNESRRCVVKTIYLQKRIEFILAEDVLKKNKSALSTETRLFRYLRRTAMELYVLTRCRHENLLHSHAIFVADGDIQIVMPRFYMLADLIEQHRIRYNSEPFSVRVIAKILRQLCIGLQYLENVGIMHRDVHPGNIFLTRNGTVKLGHFGQSRGLLDGTRAECVTPVGKQEFMSYEKQHNLLAQDKSQCEMYGFAADVWSLGVLVLQMVSFFPNEQFHHLQPDFAVVMHDARMPFAWLTTDQMQLRSRLVKSGGEELKAFLSDKLLCVDPNKRPSVSDLLRSKEMRSWCAASVEEDKQFLRKRLINDLDFANQDKLEADGPNFDALESKNIPAEFYWGDTWKLLEKQNFLLTAGGQRAQFRWGAPNPLFRILSIAVEEGRLQLADLMIVEPAIDRLAFQLVQAKGIVLPAHTTVSLPPTSRDKDVRLFPIVLEIVSTKRKDSLGWSTDDDEEGTTPFDDDEN